MADKLESGYRDKVIGRIHDMDRNKVAVEYPHEVIDTYRTDWGIGCFDESLRKSLPPMVFNHDPNTIIGRAEGFETNRRRTLVIGKFANPEHVPKAREVRSLLEDGMIPGWSFHFRNAKSIEHPNVRGARRFVKADMMEFSPVTFPSIPGAVAVGLRSFKEFIEMPDPTTEGFRTPDYTNIFLIFQAVSKGEISEAQGREMIAKLNPEAAEAISLIKFERTTTPLGEGQPHEGTPQGAGSPHPGTPLGAGASSAARSALGQQLRARVEEDAQPVLTVMEKVTEDTRAALAGVEHDMDLPLSLRQAAVNIDAVGQGLALLRRVLDLPAVEDPDAVRAMVEGKSRDELPDSAFAYIESGGTVVDGRTRPFSKRHFEIQDAAHVRDALARIAGGAKFGDEALPKVRDAAKKFGIKVDADIHPARAADGTNDDAAARLSDVFAKYEG